MIITYAGTFRIYLRKAQVNVHPSKTQVRFADDNFVYDLIKKAILSVLEEKIFLPKMKLSAADNEIIKNAPESPAEKNAEAASENSAEEIIKVISDDSAKESVSIDDKTRTNLEKEITESDYKKKFLDYLDNISPQTNLKSIEKAKKRLAEIIKKGTYNTDIYDIDFDDKDKDKNNDSLKLNETVPNFEEYEDNILDFYDVKSYNKEIFKNYTIIGQIFNTYWIIEKENSLFLLDQHAIHEKVLFEKLSKDIKNKKAKSQRLLIPMAVKLNEIQIQSIEDNIEIFENSGFEIEKISEDTIAVNSVPYIFNEPANPLLFVEIADALMDKNIESLYDTKYDLMASMSCKAAVKGNKKLSYSEAKELIDSFIRLDNPFNCPHGRPTLIEITKTEIEKNFKRIQ